MPQRLIKFMHVVGVAGVMGAFAACLVLVNIVLAVWRPRLYRR